MLCNLLSVLLYREWAKDVAEETFKFKEVNYNKHFSLILEDWKKEAKSTKLHIRRKKLGFFNKKPLC